MRYTGTIHDRQPSGFCIDTYTGKYVGPILGVPVYRDDDGSPVLLIVPGNRQRLGWADACPCPRMQPIPRAIIEAGNARVGASVPPIVLAAARTACAQASSLDDVTPPAAAKAAEFPIPWWPLFMGLSFAGLSRAVRRV